jgi:predicted nucleic acid-binding protein
LDACALIAFVNKESGFDKVSRLMDDADRKNIFIIMNQINLFEVYYRITKIYNKNKADEVLQLVREEHPITVIHGLTYNVMEEAARMRMTYNMSMGDSVAAAESVVGNGTLVTSDHKDFGKVEQVGKIKVLWFK